MVWLAGAYLIAAGGLPGWLILFPQMLSPYGSYSPNDAWITPVVLVAPPIWALWMLLTLIFDKRAFLLALPGGLAVLSPPAIAIYFLFAIAFGLGFR